jgi:hypothetical protein
VNAWQSQRSGNWGLTSTDSTSPWYDNSTQTGWAGIPDLPTDTVEVVNGHEININVGVADLDGTTIQSGTLNIAAGVTVGNVPSGLTITTNAGTVTTNASGGVVTTNDGTVTTNAGVITAGSGTVTINVVGGTVGLSAGVVAENQSGGVVTVLAGDSGTVEQNAGIIYLTSTSSAVVVKGTGPGTVQPLSTIAPATGDVKSGVSYNSATGIRVDCPIEKALTSSGNYGDPGTPLVGTWAAPTNGGVSATLTYGVAGAITGGLAAAKIMDVTYGTLAAGSVLSAAGGTYHVTGVAEVLDSVSFGAASAQTGTYHAPSAAEVISTAVFGPASGTPGTYVAPVAADVRSGVANGVSPGVGTMPPATVIV